MRPLKLFLIGIVSFLLFGGAANHKLGTNENIISYVVDPKTQDIRLFWKNEAGERFGNAKRLKDWAAKNGKSLVFAMNGGMYLKDGSPQGLYIENGKEIKSINKVQEAYGNFYMQPNGVFSINNQGIASVLSSEKFENKNVRFATQSGPMLLVNGEFHPKFRKGSSNLHIRNGVGVLPNGKVLLAMSKDRINFYDFALFFKNQGCKNALYLDGFVSRTYLPAKNWIQEDGNFGVIIGVLGTKK